MWRKCPSPTVSNPDDNFCHNLTLPPCDTDVFEGDYLSWPTFRDLFTAVYINNSRLSKIERLCHLVRKTSGEAREIVSKCPLTNQGFDVAWQNLSKAYENPRMLVNNQLKSLFGLPFLDKETSSDLKSLQRGINACLTAMSIYDISTNSWDPIIVFICIQRLPTSTVCLWEQSVKDKSALSLWKDLDLFLTERIQTLDCLRDLKGTEYVNSTEQKSTAHSTNATFANSSCVLCPNEKHYLHVCRRFQNLSFSDRFSTVKRFHCCINCLSRTHKVENCSSSYNCAICDKRHHTLIHRDISNDLATENSSNCEFGSPVTASQLTNSAPEGFSAPSTSGTNTNLNRQVFHTSHNQSVILGTAMVNIIHQGTTYQARALIDPASEASFISERLQQSLKLSSKTIVAEISGVNQAFSATSKKSCSLKIGSPIDPSIILETSALVLPNISGHLPSCRVNSDLGNISPNLRLADSNPFDSRPVDLLLGSDLYPKILLGGIHQNILGSLIAQNTVFGWILTGPLSPSKIRVHTTNVNYSKNIPNKGILCPSLNLVPPLSSKLRPRNEVTPLTHAIKSINPTFGSLTNSGNRFQNNKISLKNSHRKITLHDFVIIKDDRLPPTSWNIGQIIKTYSNTNGHVNFADIKITKGVVNRSIKNLVLINSF